MTTWFQFGYILIICLDFIIILIFTFHFSYKYFYSKKISCVCFNCLMLDVLCFVSLPTKNHFFSWSSCTSNIFYWISMILFIESIDFWRYEDEPSTLLLANFCMSNFHTKSDFKPQFTVSYLFGFNFSSSILKLKFILLRLKKRVFI